MCFVAAAAKRAREEEEGKIVGWYTFCGADRDISCSKANPTMTEYHNDAYANTRITFQHVSLMYQYTYIYLDVLLSSSVIDMGSFRSRGSLLCQRTVLMVF